MVKKIETRKTIRKRRNQRVYILMAFICLIVAGLVLTIHNHLFSQKKAVPGIIIVAPNPQAVKSSTITNTNKAPSPSITKNPTTQQTTTKDYIATNNGSLSIPYGTFVSNHAPTISGAGNRSSEESVCITSPGVECIISFSLNGVTRSLPAQKTDNSGSAYWTWDISSAGLTVGSWSISATATLNGQSKAAYDSLKLEVSQ